MSLLQSSARLDVVGVTSSTIGTRSLTGVTAGNTVMVVGAISNGDPDANMTISVSDNVNGAHTVRLGAYRDALLDAVQMGFIAFFPNSGAGNLTFTVTAVNGSDAAGYYGAIKAYEINEIPTSAIEAVTFVTADDVDTSAADISVGPTGTLSQATCLAVSVIGITTPSDTDLNTVAPSTWTLDDHQDDGFNIGHFAVATKVLNSTSAVTAAWSHDNNTGDHGAGVLVVFKQQSGAAVPKLSLLGVG